MFSFYKKKLLVYRLSWCTTFAFLAISILCGVETRAQYTQIPLSGGNPFDVVVNGAQSGAVSGTSGDGYAIGNLYAIPDYNFTYNGNAPTHRIQRPLTPSVTYPGVNYAFGGADGTNVTWAELTAPGNNTLNNLSTSIGSAIPLQKFYMLGALSYVSASAQVPIKIYVTYAEAPGILVFVKQVTLQSMANSGGLNTLPMTLVTKSNGAFSNGYFCEVEVDLTSITPPAGSKSPYQVICRDESGAFASHLYFFAITTKPVPLPNISGKVFSDNTNNEISDGIGTNAAATYVSCVDDNNKVNAYASVNSDGTYQILNAPFSNSNTSSYAYKLVLTSTLPVVGNTLSVSSLSTGWVYGTNPDANHSGLQTNAVLSVTRNVATDMTGQNFSVHKLPTSNDRTITIEATGMPSSGSLHPMTNVQSNTNYNSTDGILLDLRGIGSTNSDGTNVDVLNGYSNNASFILTSISNGQSLVYNGSPVSVNTVYPETGTYSNNLLYYKYSTSTSLQSYNFNYKIIDKLGFVSQNEATYSIILPYSLPVKYGKELTAIKAVENVQLSWATANEINNKGFNVQRSSDGKTFQNIGYVKSKAVNGNSSTAVDYNYIDVAPVTGTNYYRLKQEDLDGKSSYSKVVSINYEGTVAAIKLYPNPAIDYIHVGSVAIGTQLSLYSMDGKLLKIQVSTTNTEQVNVSNLSSGLYILKVVNSNGNHISIKFMKK